MIKVLIVDDDKMLCESMKIILSLDNEIEAVGTASNGDEAFKFCLKNPIDVILMDIRMPVCDGVSGTKKIKDAFSNIKIIILTTFNDDEYIVKALKNGASGYLLKTVSPDKIIEDIKVVYNGNMLIHDNVASKISEFINQEKRINYSKYNLSNTEIKIIEFISDGYSNKEIANKIFLSEGTVKNKISEILSKLALRDRTQIAIFHLKGGNFKA